MKKMKTGKKLLTLLLMLTLVFTMVGCGSDVDTPAGKDEGGKSETPSKAEEGKEDDVSADTDKKTVEFWHTMGGRNGELIDEMIASYNASQDTVEVVGNFQGGYWEAASKAQSAVGVGEAPDLLMMGADHVSIFAAEEGLLSNLKPYLDQEGMSREDFVDAFIWDYYLDDDTLVATPFGRSTPVMFTNNDMLKDAGLEVPTNWEELVNVSNALAIPDEQWGLGLPGADTWYWFMIVAQAGGNFINEERTGLGGLEDGTMHEGFKFWQDLQNSGGLYFGPPTDSNTTVRQLFLDQKIGMFITSCANLGTISEGAEFDFSIEWVPEGKERVVPSGGASLVMLESSDVKDETWDFMHWLMEDEHGSAYFVREVGYLPYTYAMTETETIQTAWEESPNYKNAFEQLEYASDKGHRVPQIGNMLNDILVAVEAIMYDNEDVQQQLDILAPKVEAVLATD